MERLKVGRVEYRREKGYRKEREKDREKTEK